MVTPRLNCVETTVHGGVDPTELRRLGLNPDQVLDFSANLNPFGPSSAVRVAMASAAIDQYPDRGCCDLRLELARQNGLATEQVLVGNGSCELIWLASLAFLTVGDDVLVLGPVFGEYDRSARIMGASVRACEASSLDDFCPPVSRLAGDIRELRPKMILLATPNNPTGQTISTEAIFELAEAHSQSLFVLDEAYRDCSTVPILSCRAAPSNVLRLRSLTKMHGLAGLRLGYALGAEQVIMALRAVQPSWSVNAPAQVAGLAALRDQTHLRECLIRWTEAKYELVEQLRKAGFAPVDSTVPFFLLPVGDAARCRSRLLRYGILVRDCTSFGLAGYVRISSRGKEENARLVDALVKTRTEAGLCKG
jgi:histidinol-phosphate aminotransferase